LLSCLSTKQDKSVRVYGSVLSLSDPYHEISVYNEFILKTAYEISKINNVDIGTIFASSDQLKLSDLITHRNIKFIFEKQLKNLITLKEEFNTIKDNSYLYGLIVSDPVQSTPGNFIGILAYVVKLRSYISYSEEDFVWKCVFTLTSDQFYKNEEQIIKYIINSYLTQKNEDLFNEYIKLN
jgi:hypothetical protein